jgi:hypothetical protein
MNAEATSDNGDVDRILELIHGFRISQALHVAVALGLADLLADQIVGCRELAEQTDTNAGALYRLLRALAAVGVVHEHPGEHFSLTRLGKFLRSDVPGSRAGWIRNAMRPPIWQAWQHLLHSVRTGEAAFEHTHGTDIWSFRSKSPEESAIFDLAMREGSLRVGAEFLSHYDLTPFKHVVDVGGGDGTFLATLLAGCSETKGTVFDQPHVVAGAPEVLKQAGVEQRCRVVAGSFFADLPPHADAYILKFILHDWDDDRSVQILTACRRAMAGHAKLLIIERVLAPPNEGLEGKLSDLNMMVILGGRERSRAEFAALARQADLMLGNVLTLPGGLSVLEVTR